VAASSKHVSSVKKYFITDIRLFRFVINALITVIFYQL
jgi:hypothetical protein